MKVYELIRALQKCSPDAKVLYEETPTEDDGVVVSNIIPVNSVYERAIRLNEDQPWCVKDVVLTFYEEEGV